jgi:hypothetical protein
MSHSKEPWYWKYGYIFSAEHKVVTYIDPRCDDEISQEDADRIVACVNACRGIPTELLGRVEHACIADNARMLGLELRPTHLDLLAIAEILRKAGFDVCEPVSAGR